MKTKISSGQTEPVRIEAQLVADKAFHVAAERRQGGKKPAFTGLGSGERRRRWKER
jgi:hypothetical protein